MKRSIGVTVIAVLSLLGSALMFLMGVGVTLVVLLVPLPQTKEFPGSPAFFKSMMLMSAFMYILPAVWGIVTGIGLFRLREWARISMIVFSVILTLVSGCMVLGSLLFFIPSAVNQTADPAVLAGVRWFMVGFSLLVVGIGIWWLVFFTRTRVKQQFVALGATPPPQVFQSEPGLPVGGVPSPITGRPLSITIIAWFLLVGCLFIPLCLVLHSPAMLFTKLLTGWGATLYFLTLGALQLYIGIGLLRLNPASRSIAVGYYGFVFINMAVFYLAPGAHSRMVDLMQRSQALFPWGEVGQQESSLPFDPTVLMPLWAGIGLITLLIPLYFLVTRKKAFEKAALSAAV